MSIGGLLGPLFPEIGRPLRAEDAAGITLGWDSMRQIDVMLTLEDAFEIELTTEETLALRSVGSIVEILRRRGLDVEV